MLTRPLSDSALLKINHALVNVGFSALDIERALKGKALYIDTVRHEPSSITTTICLDPDGACIFFKFGNVRKLGMRFRYPPIDADDDKITYFIDDIISAVASDED